MTSDTEKEGTFRSRIYHRLRRTWPLLFISIFVMFCITKVLEIAMGRPTTLGGLVILLAFGGASAGALVSIIAALWRR